MANGHQPSHTSGFSYPIVTSKRNPFSRHATAMCWHKVVIKYKSVMAIRQMPFTQDEAFLCSAQSV